jgi:hypothetical protein
MVMGALLKTNAMLKKDSSAAHGIKIEDPSEFKARVLAMVEAFE